MARDDQGRFIKESQQAMRTYKKDLEEMEKSAGRLEGVYRQLAQRAVEIEDATEKTKNQFQEQVDIGAELAKNKKNIFAYDLESKDLSKEILQAREDNNEEEELLSIKPKDKVEERSLRNWSSASGWTNLIR